MIALAVELGDLAFTRLVIHLVCVYHDFSYVIFYSEIYELESHRGSKRYRRYRPCRVVSSTSLHDKVPFFCLVEVTAHFIFIFIYESVIVKK